VNYITPAHVLVKGNRKVVEAMDKVRRLRTEELSTIIRRAREENAGVTEIEDACMRAENAGVNVESIDVGRLEVRRIRADHKIAMAMRVGVAVQLEEACRDAEAASVDSTRMDKAWVTVRRLCANGLTSALKSGDLQQMKKACTHAERVGVPHWRIEEVREQFRQSCINELPAAVQSCNAQRIDEQCMKAEQAGVASGVLRDWWAKAEWLRANQDFSAAMLSACVDRMQKACDHVDAAGLALGMQQVGHARVSLLQEERERIRKRQEERTRMEEERQERERQQFEARLRLEKMRREEEERRYQEEQRQRLEECNRRERERREREDRQRFEARNFGEDWWRCSNCQKRLVRATETALKPDSNNGCSCRTRSHPTMLELEEWKPQFQKALCSCGHWVGAIDLSTDEFCLKAGSVVDENGGQPKKWQDLISTSRGRKATGTARPPRRSPFGHSSSSM